MSSLTPLVMLLAMQLAAAAVTSCKAGEFFTPEVTAATAAEAKWIDVGKFDCTSKETRDERVITKDGTKKEAAGLADCKAGCLAKNATCTGISYRAKEQGTKQEETECYYCADATKAGPSAQHGSGFTLYQTPPKAGPAKCTACAAKTFNAKDDASTKCVPWTTCVTVKSAGSATKDQTCATTSAATASAATAMSLASVAAMACTALW